MIRSIIIQPRDAIACACACACAVVACVACARITRRRRHCRRHRDARTHLIMMYVRSEAIGSVAREKVSTRRRHGGGAWMT